MSGTPFEFRWGPGRLVSAGIHLDADQAACAETTGKAIVVAPLIEPDQGDGGMWQVARFDDNDEPIPIVQPQVIDVVLNDLVEERDSHRTVSYMRQDDLDYYNGGPGWREFGKVVGENKYGDFRPGQTCWGRDCDFPLWAAVMIDDATAKRIELAAECALSATDWMAVQDFSSICNGEYMLEDDDAERMSACWGVPFKINPDYGIWEPTDTPDFMKRPDLVPDYEHYLDPQDNRLWNRLLNKAKSGWVAHDKLTKATGRWNGQVWTPNLNPFG